MIFIVPYCKRRDIEYKSLKTINSLFRGKIAMSALLSSKPEVVDMNFCTNNNKLPGSRCTLAMLA